MGAFASPPDAATFATALIWPLAAGVAVVLWSKMRAAAHARRVAAMETQLQSLYRTVESKAVPAQLQMVVDALQEGEELVGSGKVKAPAAPIES